jgi:hypothetical protein
MAPQSKGGSKTQKKTNEHYKGRFLNTYKLPFMFFLAIKGQTLFLKLQMVLL